MYSLQSERALHWRKDWNFRNKISEYEGAVSKRIQDISALTYEDVYAIHRFYTTALQARLGLGDIPGAKKLALYLIKLSQFAQSQTLTWLSELLMCETLLLEGNHNDMYQRIKKIEASLDDGKPNPELKCRIHTLKLNSILDAGCVLDNFSDIVLWSLPYGAENFTNLQIASFSACVALIK